MVVFGKIGLMKHQGLEGHFEFGQGHTTLGSGSRVAIRIDGISPCGLVEVSKNKEKTCMQSTYFPLKKLLGPGGFNVPEIIFSLGSMRKLLAAYFL